jgi:hypothetical protein
MFRPAGLLATLVAPTLVPSARSSGDLYVRAYHGSLPPRAADMLTVQTEQLTARGLSPLQIDSLLGCSPDKTPQRHAAAFPLTVLLRLPRPDFYLSA